MRPWSWPPALLLACLVLTGCGYTPRSLTPERAAQIEESVRAFTRTVAHDVTQEGPSAWSRHLSSGPSFFMAVNGNLAFPNGAAAAAGLQDIARVLKKVELQWGDDLRVDLLTANLAVIAAPYREIQEWADGRRVEERGYFTGLAEFREDHWKFRNAHWSSAVPVPPANRH